MSYRLFIDDERYPVTNDWIIVRSSEEAIRVVSVLGCPTEISFDHDLGGEDTSMIFVHWFINAIIECDIDISSDFVYNIHSQNPIGKANIKGLLDCFLNYWINSSSDKE